MRKSYQGIWTLAALAVAFSAFAGTAFAGEVTKYQAGERRSGYTYAKQETQMIQDDDLANPGYLWVDEGEALWNKVDGKAGNSCASCHDGFPWSWAKAFTKPLPEIGGVLILKPF